jgi:hypothetical protein
MGWLDLIIENPDKGKKKQEASAPSQGQAAKFPESGYVAAQSSVTMPTSVVMPPQTNLSCEPYLATVLEVYDNGFEKLNQPGYDFFEFYKAVTSAGIDNPSVYQMAITMAQTMDKNVSKDNLVSQSDFYVNEIMKVHSQYVEGGTKKRQELLSKKESEKKQLETDLASLKMQLEAITNQINLTNSNLMGIDNKYASDLTEVDCKLMANDVAKDRILVSIEKVKQGLINNVK